MRTLLITYDFPPLVSGIATQFFYLWKNFATENDFIFAPVLPGFKKSDAGMPFKVLRYPYFFEQPFIRNALLFPSIFFFLAAKKIDMLICAVPVSIGALGVFFKKIFKIPFCVFYYGGEFAKYKRNRFLFWVLKQVLRQADCVVPVSEFSRQELQIYGVDELRIFKITPGVDTTRFLPGLGCDDLRRKLGLRQEKVLLTVARLARRKGIDSVINALSKVREKFPETVYLIIGTGKDEKYLKGLVREKGLESQVRFLGALSEEELPYYYALCDIYIMPNRQTEGEETVEGFGISFIEASACAKPVIAGISGGVKDAVVDKVTGLLVDPESIPSLSEAVCRLLQDEAYSRQLGRNGRLRVEREFQWEGRAGYFRMVLEKAWLNSRG